MSSNNLLKGGAVVALAAASIGLAPYLDRLGAMVTGDAVEPLNVDDGPAPAWIQDIKHEFTEFELTADGTILLLRDGNLVGLRDGSQTFVLEGNYYGWIATPPSADEPSIIPTADGFMGVSSAGVIMFEVPLPMEPDGADEEDEESETEGESESDTDADDHYDYDVGPTNAAARAIARAGDEWIVGDAEARFFRFSSAACESDPKTCARPLGRLDEETLDSDAQLYVADGELIVLQEGDVLRAFAPDLTQRWELRAKDMLGHVHLSDKGPLRVIALIDDDLVLLDPQRCDAPKHFRPSSYPQKGRLVIGESCDPEWDDCTPPGPTPSGCVLSRTYLEDVDFAAFAVVGDGTVVLNGTETAAMLNGERQWQHQLYSSGDIVPASGALFTVSVNEDDGDPMQLWSLTADGEVAWKSELPANIDGWIISIDDIVVRAAGNYVAAGNREHVAVFDLAE